MAKRPIITIAGSQGSGKSSTAKLIAKELGYRHFSSGDLFREIAKERDLSIEAINLTAEDQKEIDYMVDERLRSMKDEEGLVIDSRLAFHWMPESFKVYLSLDPDTAAERIYNHIMTEGRTSQTAQSVAEAREKINVRVASERKRYFDLYGLDPTDPKHFNLVIDTKTNDLPSVVSSVITPYKSWLSEKS
ncbi:MAG: AAA family ATPase [Patescibacteria group bacterium]|mgnify:CR=1 FL=1